MRRFLTSSSRFRLLAAAPLLRRAVSSSFTAAAAAEEEDRELEEEEFRAMDAAREDEELLPIIYRLAAKADAFDAELMRLSYVLFEKPQLVADIRAATLTGRPSSVLDVTRHLDSNDKSNSANSKCSVSCRQPVGWSKPRGLSSPLVQVMGRVRRICLAKARGSSESTAQRSDELATLTMNLDYLRRMKRLHALNYYSRMNMTPKRNLWLALYAVIWNVLIAAQNALGCVCFGAMRGVRDKGFLIGLAKGTISGTFKATQFLAYGLVLSPLIHIPCSLVNSVYGARNAITGTLFFEASAGRWQYCTVEDAKWLRHDLLVEQRAIRGVGRLEFRRKNMKPEEKWRQRLASMGFSFNNINKGILGKKGRDKSGSSTDMDDPYEVLQVKRTASQAQVKTQYKKLAKVFHPDAVQNQKGGVLSEKERREAQTNFENISTAYQILSNPEKRKSYDLGGAQALRLHESKMGHFMSRTPEEMIQSVFGGEPFRQVLLGSLLRSHWHLRNEAQVSVSIHEFEELQCIRCRLMSLQLAHILDVHAQHPLVRSASMSSRAGMNMETVMESLGGNIKSPHRRAQQGEPHQSAKGTGAGGSPFVLIAGSNEYNCFSRDFEERCERFTRRLADACFGRELMYVVGQSYIISSQRFLGILPFYAPKLHVYRKVFSGIDRVFAAFREKIDEKSKKDYEWLAQKILIEYFSMEFDSVVADSAVALRYAAQNVLQDVAVSEEQRLRRCYAMWYLGELMVRKGAPWSGMKKDDGELLAYLQQAANSVATTGEYAQKTTGLTVSSIKGTANSHVTVKETTGYKVGKD